jgi:PAS domain S-box-containing protein
MTDALNTVRMFVSEQLLAAALLSILLWSLHARLHRQEFNRWWASAWTVSALFLAAGRVTLMLPPGWSLAKGTAVLLTTLLGFLVAPLLTFGAVSLRWPGKLTRSVALGGLGATVALGTLTFAWSLEWLAQPMMSASIRGGIRGGAHTGALLFCSWVFLDRARTTRSWAAIVTGVACFAYAVDQGVFAAAHLSNLIGSATGSPGGAYILAPVIRSTLLVLDVGLTVAIAIGMVLLLVEEYDRAERALFESIARGRAVAEENTTLQLEIGVRQQIELELRISEDRYRDLVEHSEDLLCTHDLEGRILSCNPRPAQILGYHVSELLTMSVRDLLAPDVQAQFDQYLESIRRNGVAEGLMKVVTRSGEFRVWAFRSTLRTEGVAVPIIRGMARDVTQQHQAEQALKRSEEKFTVAFRSSPCAIVLTALADGRFLDVNEAFESQIGYSRAELLDRTSLEVGIWDDPADRAALRAALLEHGRVRAREVRLRHKGGGIGTVVLSAEVVPVGGERCVLWAGLDVTARKDAEARHRAILRALPDWVFLTSSDGVFVEFQARDRRHLAMSPAECIGRHITEVFPPDVATRIISCFQEALRSNQPSTLEYSVLESDEDRFYELRSVRSDGDQILSIVRDVTDQRHAEHRARQLQVELAHAGRVMALGTLTGSLAHEINQPLAAIKVNAQAAQALLGFARPDLSEVRAALGDIMSDNQRIDAVLRRLRALLSKEPRDYAPVDVNVIVDEVLALAHSDIVRRQISLNVALAPSLPLVYGDRIQLQQVLLNLLMNAYDAVLPTDIDQRRVTLTTAAEDGHVIVSVADRGVGVSDEQLRMMFQPFFTTKRDGMGLGLSICRTIVDAHGGVIAAARNPDRGLTCSFSLPAFAQTPVARLESPARMDLLGVWN